jgi:hypothetical protein
MNNDVLSKIRPAEMSQETQLKQNSNEKGEKTCFGATGENIIRKTESFILSM